MKLFSLLLVVSVSYVSCLTDEELAAFTPRDPDYVDINTGLKAEVWAKDNGDNSQTLYSNAIPSHETWKFPRYHNPNYVLEHNITLKIYKEPIMRADPLRCLPMGPIGLATSGTAIFTWWPAEEGCPDVHDFEELDICNGHPSPDDLYHYHYYTPCVQMPICGKPSTIWGVAIDGIPIYGPIDEDGVQLTKQDLDECGGKYDSGGRYKYHITQDPPYSLGCFRGEMRSDLGGNLEPFFCSCPFDDRMFKHHNRYEKLAPPPEPSTCDFSANNSTPATCTDNIDTSYDIGYTWEWLSRLIDLAPCCPEGVDCGSSCKTANGTKDACYVEQRTIKYWTRVKKTDYEMDENVESSEDEEDEVSDCLASCVNDCEILQAIERSLELGQDKEELEKCEEKCYILCSIEATLVF